MKTVISLPDDLFWSAERAARELRMSRSQFYTVALLEYLKRYQAAKITERLDEIYSQEPAKIDPVLCFAQINSLRNDCW